MRLRYEIDSLLSDERAGWISNFKWVGLDFAAEWKSELLWVLTAWNFFFFLFNFCVRDLESRNSFSIRFTFASAGKSPVSDPRQPLGKTLEVLDVSPKRPSLQIHPNSKYTSVPFSFPKCRIDGGGRVFLSVPNSTDVSASRLLYNSFVNNSDKRRFGEGPRRRSTTFIRNHLHFVKGKKNQELEDECLALWQPKGYRRCSVHSRTNGMGPPVTLRLAICSPRGLRNVDAGAGGSEFCHTSICQLSISDVSWDLCCAKDVDKEGLMDWPLSLAFDLSGIRVKRLFFHSGYTTVDVSTFWKELF